MALVKDELSKMVDSKLTKKIKGQLEQYEEETKKKLSEPNSPVSESRSPFLRRGVRRSNSRRVSVGRGALPSFPPSPDASKRGVGDEGNKLLPKRPPGSPKGGAAGSGPDKPRRRSRLKSVRIVEPQAEQDEQGGGERGGGGGSGVKKNAADKAKKQVEDLSHWWTSGKKDEKRAKRNKKKNGKEKVVFTQETATSLSERGGKGVSKKKRRLHDKTVTEHERMMKKNVALRKRMEEGKRQRDMMRAKREEADRVWMIKNKAAVKMAKNWKSYLNRKAAKAEHVATVRRYAKQVAEKLIERGFKNCAHR